MKVGIKELIEAHGEDMQCQWLPWTQATAEKKFCRIVFYTDIGKDNSRDLEEYAPLILWLKRDICNVILKEQKEEQKNERRI